MANNPAMVVRVAASVAELKKNLAEGKVQIETTTAAMQRMATGLSGDKLIQKAHDITAAVQSIGGASKLTDAEIGRVNATLDKAIQKYERLGKEAPPAMVALRDATVQTEKPTSLLDSVVGSLGPKILATFSVGAVTAFAKGLIDQGSVVADLAQRYELSTGAVQRFKYAAELGGATLDDVSKAVRFASDALGGGDNKSFNAALEKAGLSAAQLRAMKPEDVFLAITDAVKQIEDPFLRANVAQDLLGKNASVLMPAIRDGFREVGASATQMSGEAVTAMDWIGDKLSTFGPYVKTVVANNITQAWTEYRDLMRLIKNEAPDVMATVGNTTAFERVPPAVQATTRSIDELQKENDALVKQTQAAIDKSDAHSKKIQALADTLSGSALAAKVREVEAAYRTLTPAQRASEDVHQRVTKEVMRLASEGAKLPPALAAIWRETAVAEFNMLGLVRTTDKVNANVDRLLGHPPKPILDLGLLENVHEGVRRVDAQTLTAERDTRILQRAYTVLGLNSSAALRDFAGEAKQAYADIRDNASSTTADIEAAWWVMIDAQREAADVSVGIWREANAGILGLFERLGVDIDGVWATSVTRFSGTFLNGITSVFGDFAPSFMTILGDLGTLSGKSFVERMANSILGFDLTGLISRWTGGPSPERLKRVIGQRQNPETGRWEPVYGVGVEQDDPRVGLGPNESHRTDDQFATGTHGRYLDFGAGTRVTLHGRERVTPEAEGRREAANALTRADFDRFVARLEQSINSNLNRALGQLPLMVATATRDAVALQGRRR